MSRQSIPATQNGLLRFALRSRIQPFRSRRYACYLVLPRFRGHLTYAQ